MQYSQWDVQGEDQREKLRWFMEKKCEKKREKGLKRTAVFGTLLVRLSPPHHHHILPYLIFKSNLLHSSKWVSWWNWACSPESWWASSQTSWIGKLWVPTTGLSGCETVLFHDYVSVVQMYMGVDQGISFWIDLCGSMWICVHTVHAHWQYGLSLATGGTQGHETAAAFHLLDWDWRTSPWSWKTLCSTSSKSRKSISWDLRAL